MSTPIIYNWPLADEIAIVNATQLGAGIRTFVFNGTLATVYGQAIVLTGIERKLSLKSAGNLSGITFTITGLSGMGKIISETITGPNATTKYTVNTYNTIVSITINADMGAAVSIGTGLVGATNWFTYNVYNPFPALAVQVNVQGTTTAPTYTFQATLDDAESLEPADITVIEDLIANMVAATTDQFGVTNAPLRFARINITASDATSILVADFVQQGQS